MEYSPNLRNRAWLLGLIVLANRAGMRPLSKGHLHSLVFLANSLAPLYEDAGIESRVVRHEHGPFYPDAQWDADRMVAQGLIKVIELRYIETDSGWWMKANYQATQKGEDSFNRFRRLPLLGRSFQFLLELTTAFTSISRDAMDTAPLHDAIYRMPGQAKWATTVFEDAESNYSVITADAFSQLVGAEINLSAKERLQLYLNYIGNLASSANREEVH